MVSGDAVDGQDSFLQPLDGRAALAGVGVVRADAHLQEDADQLHLVAHGLEEELLEGVGGLVELAGVELGDGGDESGIVLDVHNR